MSDQAKILAFIQDTPGWHTAFQVSVRIGFTNEGRDDRKIVSAVLKELAQCDTIQTCGFRRDKRYARIGEPAYSEGAGPCVTEDQLNAVLACFTGSTEGFKFGRVKETTGLDIVTVRAALKTLVERGALGSTGSRAQTRYHLPGVILPDKPKNVSPLNVERSKATLEPKRPPPRIGKAPKGPKRANSAAKESAPVQQVKETTELESPTVQTAPQQTYTVEQAIDLVIKSLTRGKWVIPWDLPTLAHDRYGVPRLRGNERVLEILRDEETCPFERKWDDSEGRRLMVRLPFEDKSK